MPSRGGIAQTHFLVQLTDGTMASGPTQLLERKWLNMFEATTYLAVGEALSIEALRRSHYPSARVWLAEMKSAWERCRDECRIRGGEYSEFLTILKNHSQDLFHPPPSAVLCRTSSWPPSGQFLYESILKWEQSHEQDEKKRAKAEPQILRALLSGKVLFNGERDGLREDIDVRRSNGAAAIDFYADIVEAFPGTLSSYAGHTLKWTGVHVEIANLLEWHQVSTTIDRTEAAAIKDLAEKLKNNPQSLRDEAFQWLRNHGYEVKWRPFHYRIWPQARRQAGLPEKAPPGPKPRSSC